MISIRTTHSQLEYHNQKASLELSVPQPQMDMQNEKTRMDVTNEPAQMHVDSTEMWASFGLYGPIRATKMEAQRGMQAAYDATGEVGDQWRAMMQPGAGNEEMAQIARQRMREGIPESQLIFTPDPPEITWTPPQFGISWTPHQLNIAWQTNTRPQMQYNPYSFTTTASGYNVDFQYLGEPKTGGDVLRVIRQYA